MISVAAMLVAAFVWNRWPNPSYIADSDSRIDVSPDGRRLVFSAAYGLGSGLYFLNLRSMQVTHTRQWSQFENYPSFSPDGNELAYAGCNSLQDARHIFVMNLRTGVDRQLTAGPAASDTCPRFSGDGKCIVFERGVRHQYTSTDDPWTNADLYEMNADGSDQKRITYGSYDSYLYPSASSAKSRIYFTYFYSDPQGDSVGSIFSIDSTGENQQVVEGQQTVNYEPYLSRDGRMLAYVAGSGYSFRDVYIAILPGGSPTCLDTARHANWAASPTLTSDNRFVYFIGGNPPEIWRVRTDGTEPHKIAGNQIFFVPMLWSWWHKHFGR